MTSEEANKIVAEFMGDDGFCFGQEGVLPKKYSKSLDALVPVLEKLEQSINLNMDVYPCGDYCCDIGTYHDHYSCANTIQKAATVATAKAIQELNND